MGPLRIEKSDDTPMVILDEEDNYFELSGKSMPEDVAGFYQPVLDWLNSYIEAPLSKTIFNIKLIYFNTESSKKIMDILLILEEIVAEGNDVVIRWHSLRSDEDMQEAGKEYEEIVGIPFEHILYEN
jgi:hypothetical protein